MLQPSDFAPPTDEPATTLSTQPALPSASTADPTCVEQCGWTRQDVARDLSAILCKSQYPEYELREDVTEIYANVADQALLCTGGGSMDTSYMGIAYLWDEYDDITEAVTEPSAQCDSLGAAVVGGEVDQPGYLIANIQTGQAIVDRLVEGGARLICPVPG